MVKAGMFFINIIILVLLKIWIYYKQLPVKPKIGKAGVEAIT